MDYPGSGLLGYRNKDPIKCPQSSHCSACSPSPTLNQPGPRLLRLPAHFNYGIVEDFDASMFQHYGICDKQKTIDELRKDCVPVSYFFAPLVASGGLGLRNFNNIRCNFAILEDGLC